jgi:hypothetical protein
MRSFDHNLHSTHQLGRERWEWDIHQKVHRQYDYIPPPRSFLPIPGSCEVLQHNYTNMAISSVPFLFFPLLSFEGKREKQKHTI